MKIEKIIDKHPENFYIPTKIKLRRLEYEKVCSECSKSLSDLLKNNPAYKKVTICVTDNTRPFPDKKIIPALLSTIKKHNIEQKNIVILIATGLHRHLNKSELITKFGKEIVSEYKIIQNNPDDCVRISTPGKEFYINRHLIDSDLLIGTGIFEPHQYARFSGGNKIFIIGCGGYKTIEYIHSADMVQKRGVRIGSITSNPFRNAIEYFARFLPPRWILNIIKNANGEIICFDTGSPERVFKNLSKWFLKNMQVSLARRFDGVWMKIAESKGINLYQASRGPTYIALMRYPIVKSGAPIVVSASLSEGYGRGSGEREFEEIMKSGDSNKQLYNRLSKSGYAGGGQRALMILKVIKKHPVIFTGFRKTINLERENIYFIEREEDALTFVRERFGVKKMIYIDDPFTYLYSYKSEFRREK